MFGIEIGRIEYLFIFVAVAPFFVSKSVYREVEETVKLHFMPEKLALGWNRTKGLGSRAVGSDEWKPGNQIDGDKAQEFCREDIRGTAAL